MITTSNKAQRTLSRLLKKEGEITDNGKLSERGGRKAKGPKANAMAARPPKVSILEKEIEIMAKKMKKLFSLVLAVSMLMSLLSVAASAAETDEQAKHKISLSYAGETNLTTPAAGKMDAVKHAELVDAENGIVKITMDVAGTPVTMTEGVDVVLVADESSSMNILADDWSAGNIGLVSLCLNESHWYGLDKEFVAKLYPTISVPEDASEEEKATLQAQKDEIDAVLAAIAAWESPLYFQPTDAMRFTITSYWTAAPYAADVESVLTAALAALGDGVDYTKHIDWSNLNKIFARGAGYWAVGKNHYIYNQETNSYEKLTRAENQWALPFSEKKDGCYDRLVVEKAAYSKFAKGLLQGNDNVENENQKNRVAYFGFAARHNSFSSQQSVFFEDKYDGALKTAVEYMDSNGYTNWAYGLSGALSHIRNRAEGEQDRPVYVVFISDGAPNQNGAKTPEQWLAGTKASWELIPQPEAYEDPNASTIDKLLPTALSTALAAESDGFYAIKYNVDGTDANVYYDRLKAQGAEIWNCETATEIDAVLAGIKEKIGKFYPSGTLTDTIGEGFTLIEGDARYPISSGYAKTEENEQVTLTWNFENVSRESVSFYVQLDESLRVTPGTYLTNADFVADTATVTGANLTYNALSIDADNELVEEAASVAMRSPEVTVSKVYSVTYQYDETAPDNAPAVPVDDTLYAAGETVDVADAPEMDHYVFTGWDTSVLTDGTKMPANDVVLVGGWVSAADYIMEYYVKVGDGEYTKFDNGSLPEGAPTGETVAVNTVIDKTYLDGKGLPATISDGSYTYTYDRMEGVTVAIEAENIVKIYYSYTIPVNPPYNPPVVTPPAGDDSTDAPVEELPEGDVPTTDAPEVEEELGDEDVPLAGAPEEDEIFEEDVPLADVPATGDMTALWAAASVVSAAGVLFLGKKNKDEE